MTQQLYYKNNPLLRNANVEWPLTQDQLNEYIKCANDPEYFIENYIKVLTLDTGVSQFKLRPYQQRVVKTINDNRFTIVLFPRQSGKTTSVGGYLLWYLIFHPDSNILIGAHVQKAAINFMDVIKTAYEELPYWLKPGVIEYNKLNIAFENNSSIQSTATTKNSGRGGTFKIVVLDEFAFVDKNIADAFYASIRPTISSGKDSKLIIISTPNGLNHFHKMWDAAIKGKSEFKPVEAKWNEVPGRDELFKQKIIAEFGEQKWNQEFDCKFLGSLNTLVSAYVLENLIIEYPIEELEYLKIYKRPVKNHKYFITVDTSRGKGLDYSVFVVFDVTNYPYEVVALFRDDSIPSMSYPNKIYAVAKLYNEADVLVEINDAGQQVADILNYDLEYTNVLGSSTQGRTGQVLSGGGSKLGVYMSKSVKRIGCIGLKTIIENQKIILNDADLIDELRNFILKGVSYEADEGYNDDCTMCLVIFGWAIQQPYFKDITDNDIRQSLYEKELQRMEEDLVPFGYIQSDNYNQPKLVKLDNSDELWELVPTFKN